VGNSATNASLSWYARLRVAPVAAMIWPAVGRMRKPKAAEELAGAQQQRGDDERRDGACRIDYSGHGSFRYLEWVVRKLSMPQIAKGLYCLQGRRLARRLALGLYHRPELQAA